METLEIQAKDFLVKWVTAQENGSIVWQIKPLKRSVNFAIYRKKNAPLTPAKNDGIVENSLSPDDDKSVSAVATNNALLLALNYTSAFPLEKLSQPERLSLIWSKSRRVRLSSVASVNNITERGSIKTKSRQSTLSDSLNNPDLVLIKNYYKLVPGELVKGLISTELGGTFAFIFDNTFSKTVSKTVLFSSKVVLEAIINTVEPSVLTYVPFINTVSSTSPVEVTEASQCNDVSMHQIRKVVPKDGEWMEGILAKKRRKKLQGFTKRFFILNFKHGTLSYFKVNDNKLRGQMPIAESIVSANEKTREIFIDSGMEVWNLKAPTSADFQAWVESFNALKKICMESKGIDSGSLGDDKGPGMYALKELCGDFTELINGAGQMPRPVLEAQISAIHGRFATILKITSPDSASALSDGDFYDAFDYLSDEGGVVLVTETSRKNISSNGSDDDDDMDARLLSDLDLDSETEKKLGPVIEKASASITDINAVSATKKVPASVTKKISAPDTTQQEVESAFADEKETSDILDLSPLPIDYTVDRPCDIPVFTHDPLSFLSFVRKNVGKDLSTLSMPVDMNEPITILQKYAEILEYSEMIDIALQGKYPAESGEMILRVAAFAVTYLSAMRVKSRVGRKPFNPLLGETYELVREDKGFRFIGEKVSHKPPVFAIHVESADWLLTFSPAPSQKFWGKTSEIYTSGTAKLTIRGTKEVFTWCLPTCVIKNIIAGEKYTEPCSPIIVKSSNGQKAVVEFAKGGMFSGRSEDLLIKAYDSSKRVLSYTVFGKWTTQMTLKTNTVEKEIWNAGALLPNYDKKFGFPEFSGTLNKITAIEKGAIPPTDSRYRPDMLVYAEGEIDKAEELKLKLEEGQRIRRKEQEESGKPHQPQYFKHVGGEDGDPCSGRWEYIDGENSYWERRKRGAWEGLLW